ncbi:heterokaryon incompatibility protein-domain-containing protein [Coniochaeta sp. 2T2.1]|nr:heterokaryon incompatibility protein-domain-containing protein [Coniochaeta sp. 2T2.1]
MSDATIPTCPSCQDLQPCHLDIPISKLLEGIAAECPGCALMRDVIQPFVPFAEVESVRILNDCALYVYVFFKELKGRHATIEVYAKPDSPSRWKHIGPARSVPALANSTESIGLLKRWLNDCETRHPACQVGRTATLPTRVIDVGESAETVSLYISQAGEQGTYTALSHCWGGQTPLATTQATLGDRQKSIHFDKKSRTFAEAVEVTRALGFKYLWIDSLCIIQDDVADWTAEAAKMSQVYSNAALTLSADGAADTSQGLFGGSGARTSAHNTQAITTTDPSGSPVEVYARLRSSRPSDPNTAPHSSLPTSPSKLSTRAWVLQERILSPRMVHFYNEELVWSCFGLERCECRLMAVTSSFGTFRRLLSMPAPDKPTSEHNLLVEWPKLVEQFTSKGLTYPKDRLPALSGLATLAHEKTPTSRYLAGMWSADMAYSLLWASDHVAAAESDTPIVRMPVVPFAPSWSWASVVGPVVHVDRHLDQFTNRRSGRDEVKPLLEVVRAVTTPVTSNAYGPVKEGVVVVRGQVLSVRYDFLEGTWRPVLQGRGEIGGRGLAAEVDKRPKVEPKVIPDVLDEDPRFNSAARVLQLFGEFVFLRAATYIWEGSMSSESTEVVALLLERRPDLSVSGEETYQRRGIVMHAFDSRKVWVGVPTQTISIV